MFRGLFASKSSLRRQLIAVGCLVVLCCCASQAEATCGDYLSHAGDYLGQSEQLTSLLSQEGQAPKVPAAPCNGPNCRQAPDHPPLPAPQRVVLVPTRDILGLTAVQNELVLDAQWLAAPSDTLGDSFSGLCLFRPPRSIT